MCSNRKSPVPTSHEQDVNNGTVCNSYILETTQMLITVERENQLWHIHTVEYCAVMKNNEI